MATDVVEFDFGRDNRSTLFAQVGDDAGLSADDGHVVREMSLALSKTTGVAVAANQLRIYARAFAVRAPSPLPAVVNNPKIIWKSPKRERGPEGCLSFPGLVLQISRHTNIVVEFDGFDDEGARLGKSTKELDGLWSRVFQHELDHLDGRLFLDRLPLRERKSAWARWTSMSRERKREDAGAA